MFDTSPQNLTMPGPPAALVCRVLEQYLSCKRRHDRVVAHGKAHMPHCETGSDVRRLVRVVSTLVNVVGVDSPAFSVELNVFGESLMLVVNECLPII